MSRVKIQPEKETKLHSEQEYIFEIAEELEITPTLIYHNRTTATCGEKLDLLKESPEFNDWTLDRMVKALYFSQNHHAFVGVIKPGLEDRVDTRNLFSEVLKIPKSRAERYQFNHAKTPRGMALGTCTPFPLYSTLGREISDLIIINHPSINNELVDISVGGSDPKSFSTSMHLPYSAIYKILSKKFGTRIHLI